MRAILAKSSGLVLLFACVLSRSALAQVAAPAQPGVATVVVLPFENASQAPGIAWIGEAIPEIMGQRLAGPELFLISREERLSAYDHFGIPANLRPSRATLFKLAEQMDADFAIFGRYTFDGQKYTAYAQVLDLKRLRLGREMVEAGALPALMDVTNALSWDVLTAVHPSPMLTRAAFVAQAPSVRLDALENYIRGVTADSRPEQVRRLREAVRLDPQYESAVYELGKNYFDNREYGEALNWFAKLNRDDSESRSAQFLSGLAAYYSGDYARAEEAFSSLAKKMPLTEVFNNLGAAQDHAGNRAALPNFQRAVQNDPDDPDYHFNYALALFRNGDTANAIRQLREAIALQPGDSEARTLLETASAGTGFSAFAQTPKPPLARLKRNYDEASFREAEAELQRTTEARLAQADPATHARFHVERGRELLAEGLAAEAEQNLREACRLEADNAPAHAALAAALEQQGQFTESRAEAEAALRLEPSADAYVVLTRLEMRAGALTAAAANAQKALQLQPNHAAALVLQREINTRMAGSPAAVREPK